jgi:hypothetical protein
LGRRDQPQGQHPLRIAPGTRTWSESACECDSELALLFSPYLPLPLTAAFSTDRSDATNSRIVVPVGSLQSEIGVNLTAPDGARILRGKNCRLRVGVAPCVEVSVDCRPIMELGSG